jgi:hypothetical protein
MEANKRIEKYTKDLQDFIDTSIKDLHPRKARRRMIRKMKIIKLISI